MDDCVLQGANIQGITKELEGRMMSQKNYTFCGHSTLVSVGQSTQETKSPSTFHANYQAKSNSPHPYSIAELAWNNLVHQHKSQTILFSGLANSGKTANLRLVLDYLSDVYSPRGIKLLRDFFRMGNIILSALGDAVTPSNQNHTCYASYTKVKFGHNGAVIGGYVNTYLLDTERILTRNPNERLFHIFYQLFHMDVREKALYQLGQPDEYNCLKDSPIKIEGIDDWDNFRATSDAIDGLLSSETKSVIFRVVAAVIHLSNVSFIQYEDDGNYYVSNDAVDIAASLLKVHASSLRSALGSSTKLEDATLTLNTLIQSLYERLFQYTVDMVNVSLSKLTQEGVTYLYIALLDAPGFDTEKDTLHSFSANWVNDCIQNLYQTQLDNNRTLHKKCGITLKSADPDTKPLSTFVNSTFSSIIGTLDTLVEKKEYSDQSFVKAVQTQLGQKTEGSKFQVQHSRGTVSYSGTQWNVFNNAELSDTIEDNLAGSRDDAVADVCESFRPPGPHVGQDLKSIYANNFQQISSLFTTYISTHSCYFIFCIVPSKDGKTKFDSAFVQKQLSDCGILQNSEFLAEGFEIITPIKKFVDRYRALLADKPSPSLRDSSQLILSNIFKESNIFFISEQFIFIKYQNSVEVLETKLTEATSKYVPTFQAAIRGWLTRRLLARTDASRIIQGAIRFFWGRTRDPWIMLYGITNELIEERFGDQLRAADESTAAVEAALTEAKAGTKAMEDKVAQLEAMLARMQTLLTSQREATRTLGDHVKAIQTENKDMSNKIQQTQTRAQLENQGRNRK